MAQRGPNFDSLKLTVGKGTPLQGEDALKIMRGAKDVTTCAADDDGNLEYCDLTLTYRPCHKWTTWASL